MKTYNRHWTLKGWQPDSDPAAELFRNLVAEDSKVNPAGRSAEQWTVQEFQNQVVGAAVEVGHSTTALRKWTSRQKEGASLEERDAHKLSKNLRDPQARLEQKKLYFSLRSKTFKSAKSAELENLKYNDTSWKPGPRVWTLGNGDKSVNREEWREDIATGLEARYGDALNDAEHQARVQEELERAAK